MPDLVLVGGYAGSGKTEFAKVLAERTGWALLDKDTLTRPLVNALANAICGDPDDRHSECYVSKVRPLEYLALVDTAEEVLEHGCSAVVTAPFLLEFIDPAFLSRVKAIAERESADLRVVWIDSDHPTMQKRLHRRAAERDRWKLSHWMEYERGVDLKMRPHSDYPYECIDNGKAPGRSLGESVDLLIGQWGVAST